MVNLEQCLLLLEELGSQKTERLTCCCGKIANLEMAFVGIHETCQQGVE